MINVARTLIPRRKFANNGLKFVSSGENRKSSIVAGKIIAYGLPFTIMITRP